MTTEAVLLMVFIAMVLFGVVFSENGPQATFAQSAPSLAARLERNVATGVGWQDSIREPTEWIRPNGQRPPNR